MALLLNADWKCSYTALKETSQSKEKGMNEKSESKAAIEYAAPRSNRATTTYTALWLSHLLLS